jgi:HD superfamily phosphohydrolase
MEMERTMQQMLQQLLANQAEMKADRKADQARLEARIETKRAKNQEDLKGMMEEMNAKMDTKQAKATKQEKMLAEISARMDTNLNEMLKDIKSSQVEMRATRSELKETSQHGMKVIIQPIQSELDETTACNGLTETEHDPGMMQSIEEHQEIPKEDATVMPVGERRKRRRVCNLAVKCRQKDGKDPGISWIQEEVGCRLQEGVPQCKSGMAKKGTSSRMFRPKESADRRRNWVPARG